MTRADGGGDDVARPSFAETQAEYAAELQVGWGFKAAPHDKVLGPAAGGKTVRKSP